MYLLRLKKKTIKKQNSPTYYEILIVFYNFSLLVIQHYQLLMMNNIHYSQNYSKYINYTSNSSFFVIFIDPLINALTFNVLIFSGVNIIKYLLSKSISSIYPIPFDSHIGNCVNRFILFGFFIFDNIVDIESE